MLESLEVMRDKSACELRAPDRKAWSARFARTDAYVASVCLVLASIQAFAIPAGAGVTTVAHADAAFGAKPVRLIALSTTAISITGNIRLTSTYIEFATRARLAIRYLRDVAGNVSYLGAGDGTARGRLFRVLTESDPKLLAGNRFCGRVPTFVSITTRRSHGGSDVLLTAYTGATAPRGSSEDAICAGYAYVQR